MKAKDWTHLHPKYAGKWVAFAKDQETVIASAKTFNTLMKRAERIGYEHPLTFKVPREMVLYVGSF